MHTARSTHAISTKDRRPELAGLGHDRNADRRLRRPNRGKITIGDWSARWLDGQAHLKPSTHERYAGILREHVLPQWSAVQLIDVTHADVQAWVSRLAARRSPATVRKVHRVFSLIVKTAVRDGRLARNPAAEINLPRVVATERRYLTHEQVHALAQALAKPADVSKHRRLDERENRADRLIVLFLAYTGVRFGEPAVLRGAGWISCGAGPSSPSP